MPPRRIFTLQLLASDTLAILLVFNSAAWLRGITTWPEVLVLALLAPWAMIVGAFYLIDGYKIRTDMLSVDYLSQHAIAVLLAIVGTLLLTFVIIPQHVPLQASRGVIALCPLALFPLTLWYRRLLRLRHLRTQQEHSLVFIGDAATGRAFLEECVEHRVNQPVLICLAANENPELSPPLPAGQAAPRPVESAIVEILTGRLAVEAIVLRESAQPLPEAVLTALVELHLKGIPSYTLERFHQIYWRNIPLYRLNQTWLFQEGFLIAREPAFEHLKRGWDIVLASVGLLFFSPLLLLAAMFINAEDRGPVLFRQTRIGKDRVPFTLIKLRTMQPAPAAPPAEGLYTSQRDPRITRCGRILRNTRLDEVPQLWNVLRGEMSLIGPRAEWDRLVARYEQQIPCYHFRHLVKPGITGWAQINYPYGANLHDTLRKLEYDLYYIRYFSFRLDAAIILKTIHTMLFGRGQ